MTATHTNHAPGDRSHAGQEWPFIPLFTICKQYFNHTGLISVPKSTLSRVCFRAHIWFPLSGILLSSLPFFPPEPKSCVLREIFSAALFYDPLISSFPENTTVLIILFVYLFVFCLHHRTRKSVHVILFTTGNQWLVEHQTHDWCSANLVND